MIEVCYTGVLPLVLGVPTKIIADDHPDIVKLKALRGMDTAGLFDARGINRPCRPDLPRIPWHGEVEFRYGNVRDLTVLVSLVRGRPFPRISGKNARIKCGVVFFFDG